MPAGYARNENANDPADRTDAEWQLLDAQLPDPTFLAGAGGRSCRRTSRRIRPCSNTLPAGRKPGRRRRQRQGPAPARKARPVIPARPPGLRRRRLRRQIRRLGRRTLNLALSIVKGIDKAKGLQGPAPALVHDQNHRLAPDPQKDGPPRSLETGS